MQNIHISQAYFILPFSYDVWATFKRYFQQKSILLQFFLGQATIFNRLTRLYGRCNSPTYLNMFSVKSLTPKPILWH